MAGFRSQYFYRVLSNIARTFRATLTVIRIKNVSICCFKETKIILIYR